MYDRHSARTTVRAPHSWFSAALMALALTLGPAAAAHAGTHPVAHGDGHTTKHSHKESDGNDHKKNDGAPGGIPGQIDAGITGSTEGNLATATPEPGSGELVALGVVAGFGVVLVRRSRGRVASI